MSTATLSQVKLQCSLQRVYFTDLKTRADFEEAVRQLEVAREAAKYGEPVLFEIWRPQAADDEVHVQTCDFP